MPISVRGPYLSQGDKGHRTPENCSYPSKIQSLNLTLYWNLVCFFFFGHLSVIDRIFLDITEFFFGHTDRKKFAIRLFYSSLFSSGCRFPFCRFLLFSSGDAVLPFSSGCCCRFLLPFSCGDNNFVAVAVFFW